MTDHSPTAALAHAFLARERIEQVEKPTCALCGQPAASFTWTLEPTRDGHFDVKFEVECCGCYEMVRFRGPCCQEISALAIGFAFASHPHARFSRLKVRQ
jgi:hypothetical protein